MAEYTTSKPSWVPEEPNEKFACSVMGGIEGIKDTTVGNINPMLTSGKMKPKRRLIMSEDEYVNGVLNYSENVFNITTISSTSQLVMYYKKSDDYVVIGFAKTTDNVKMQVAFINYSDVGSTEKQKCILFTRNASSELYQYILPGGLLNSASNKSSFISNDIVALYPLIDVTGRIVIHKAYISAINKSITDSFYFVVDGKAYISLISSNASANKVCIQIN